MDNTLQPARPADVAAAAPVAATRGEGAPARVRIGVIYNPRSHRNKGQDLDCIKHPDIMVLQPESRTLIADALAELAAAGVDYLIINGGDGTVRDVLTFGQKVFVDHWPVMAVLPKGKTNALNVDLGAPDDWSMADAIAAWDDGRRVVRRPVAVTREGEDCPAILGFILGGGAYTLGIRAGQGAHNLGFFNSLAVGMTSAWGVFQAIFGRDTNRWRRGTPMVMRHLPGGDPIPHSGHGDPARRFIMICSTLEHFPVGLKIFGKSRPGLKLAIMDKPLRRLLVSFPAILSGWQPDWLVPAGLFQIDVEGFTLDVGDDIILDGEAMPAGSYRVTQGPLLTFVTV